MLFSEELFIASPVVARGWHWASWLLLSSSLVLSQTVPKDSLKLPLWRLRRMSLVEEGEDGACSLLSSYIDEDVL